ncbi:unnamed protein product [Darwinula stevensoni]|uniref:Uncharacterized protein n=1 Tax=Darwinula stevensoni TaxID=69355 RepID=A0A7R8X904_9CRUS|nr:unnamed protein product [Darwinula stevensoni]CAG0888633.1 unnamed protein product [Darwinula stevensoni]
MNFHFEQHIAETEFYAAEAQKMSLRTKRELRVRFQLDPPPESCIKQEPQDENSDCNGDPNFQKVPSISDLSDPDNSTGLPLSVLSLTQKFREKQQAAARTDR